MAELVATLAARGAVETDVGVFFATVERAVEGRNPRTGAPIRIAAKCHCYLVPSEHALRSVFGDAAMEAGEARELVLGLVCGEATTPTFDDAPSVPIELCAALAADLAAGRSVEVTGLGTFKRLGHTTATIWLDQIAPDLDRALRAAR